MKISTKAIAAISSRHIVLALALALDFSEVWVNKLIAANKDNGPLTTAKSIQVIQKETGFKESEIFETENANEVTR